MSGSSFNSKYYAWKTIRKVVLQRDNFRCTNCNIQRDGKFLHVHHIDGSGNEAEEHRFSNNELINLVTLCASCHPKIHKRIPFKYFSVDSQSE